MSNLSSSDVDRHIGARIRLRRKALGLKQTDIASRIDLSYQQFQKYETGGSRITASGLYELGAILDVPVEWFFEGLPQTGHDFDDGSLAQVSAFLASPQGLRLVKCFDRLPEGAPRYKLVEFLEAIAADRDEDGSDRRGRPDTTPS